MDAEGLVARVEELSGQVEGDPLAEELAGALMELYGEGLERIFAALDENTARRLADDGVVASLMLIHGLYPVPLEDRVREALDSVRPYMETHGGSVELLGLEGGVARLRLDGSCHGCAASSTTLELGIKQALLETAPDLEGIEVVGEEITGVPLPMVGWRSVDGLDGLLPGALTVVDDLLVANLEGDLLAYRNACAACGAALDGGLLLGATLSCPSCAHSFELRLAGRSTEGSGLQLAPIPLLREGAAIQVAA
jgi:Fe-S cluster biogenesis protein NfuA/nitrite reductase/ring-hydroxylating ferredoxin subunit